MTSRPAAPESEKTERVATLRELIAEIKQPLWRLAANARLDELERSEALAQTEIKGHMRNESDLLNELALARADWACAQARIAELEKVLAIYADSKNFVEGNDWYWVGDDDPTLAAKKALKSSA